MCSGCWRSVSSSVSSSFWFLRSYCWAIPVGRLLMLGHVFGLLEECLIIGEFFVLVFEILLSRHPRGSAAHVFGLLEECLIIGEFLVLVFEILLLRHPRGSAAHAGARLRAARGVSHHRWVLSSCFWDLIVETSTWVGCSCWGMCSGCWRSVSSSVSS